MKKLIICLFLTTAIFCINTIAAKARPIIVLDSGHEPKAPGAMGTCKQMEVVYNDKMVQQIEKTLSDSYQIILTRQQGSNVQINNPTLVNHIPVRDQKLWSTKKSLIARPAIANLNQAQIFISIHHDSTEATVQIHDPALCQHKGGKDLDRAFKNKFQIGYNIFINNAEQSERKIKSLKLAELIGQELNGLGRLPSNYHIYPHDSCKSCYPVNKKLGVWNEDLAVLRNTTMPAVLIEVGNIVDADDEKIINTDLFRKQFSLALKKALIQYFKQSKRP